MASVVYAGGDKVNDAKVILRLPSEDLKAAKEKAKARNWNLSQWLREIISKALKGRI